MTEKVKAKKKKARWKKDCLCVRYLRQPSLNVCKYGFRFNYWWNYIYSSRELFNCSRINRCFVTGTSIRKKYETFQHFNISIFSKYFGLSSIYLYFPCVQRNEVIVFQALKKKSDCFNRKMSWEWLALPKARTNRYGKIEKC